MYRCPYCTRLSSVYKQKDNIYRCSRCVTNFKVDINFPLGSKVRIRNVSQTKCSKECIGLTMLVTGSETSVYEIEKPMVSCAVHGEYAFPPEYVEIVNKSDNTFRKRSFASSLI